MVAFLRETFIFCQSIFVFSLFLDSKQRWCLLVIFFLGFQSNSENWWSTRIRNVKFCVQIMNILIKSAWNSLYSSTAKKMAAVLNFGVRIETMSYTERRKLSRKFFPKGNTPLDPHYQWGMPWSSCLWHCATSRKFADSISDGVIGILPSESASNRNEYQGYLLGGKAAGA